MRNLLLVIATLFMLADNTPKGNIFTGEATSVTETRAVLSGYSKFPVGEKKVTEIGIILSAGPLTDPTAGKKMKVGSLGADNWFSINISNLTPDQTYYYKSYMVKNEKPVYGETRTFKTLAIEASATTRNATSVGELEATLNGLLTEQVKDPFKKTVWFLYSSQYSSLQGLKAHGTRQEASLRSDGGVSSQIKGLSAFTTYYYVMGAKIYDKEFYGEVKSFTSRNFEAEIRTFEPSYIGEITATLCGSLTVKSKNPLPQKVWFYYSDKETDPVQMMQKGIKVPATLGADGRFSVKLKGLKYWGRYYVMAGAQVLDKTLYGDVVSFTTNLLNVSVTTDTPSRVAETSATLAGTLNLQSKDDLSPEAWFLYSDTATTLEALKANGSLQRVPVRSGGDLRFEMFNLPSGKTYYYVAVAKVLDRELYGEVRSLKTKPIQVGITLNQAVRSEGRSYSISGKIAADFQDDLDTDAYFYVSDTEKTLSGLIERGESTSLDLDEDGSFSVVSDDLPFGKTYYYAVVAVVEGKTFQSAVKTFKTQTLPAGAVDLGLSILWGAHNLGAARPENTGNYYSWSEINAQFVGSKLGGIWRLPTSDEVQELIDECEWEWSYRQAGSGFKVTGPNGNSIFIPLTGIKFSSGLEDKEYQAYFWTGELDTSGYPLYMRCEIDGLSGDPDIYYRETSFYFALPIRPVTD